VTGEDEFLVVAYGEDTLGNNDWRSPISDFPIVVSAFNECESFGYEFPEGDLLAHLKGAGFPLGHVRPGCSDDLVSLLEALFPDSIGCDRQQVTRDMPCGGVGIEVTMRSDAERQICRVLQSAEEFLAGWRETSGIADEVRRVE
jgi:hypothetical protein